MNILLSAAVCFLPLTLFTAVLLRAVERYTVKMAFLSIAAGFASLIPIALVQFAVHLIPFFNMNSAAGVFISALVINGLIEEFFKMVFLIPFDRKKMPVNIFLICSLTAGCAIGSFETLVYLAAGTAEIGIRLVTAVVMHASCAGLSGLFLWGQKNGHNRPFLFLWAAVLHGLYNFFAGFNGLMWWYSIAVLIYTIVHIRIVCKSYVNNDSDVDNII